MTITPLFRPSATTSIISKIHKSGICCNTTAAISLPQQQFHPLSKNSNATPGTTNSLFGIATATSSRNYATKPIKIYTKTGDKGTTSLYSGHRASKSAPYFEALGHVDELNASLGLVREHAEVLLGRNLQQESESSTSNKSLHAKQQLHLKNLLEQLPQIQSRLLDCGSSIATPISSAKDTQLERVKFHVIHVNELEQWIDEFTDDMLPPLRNFILPSGGLTASQLHVARTVCRRAERSVVPLFENGDLDENVMKFLNRLSDYLFTVARVAAVCEGKEEVTYKKARDEKL